VNASPPAQPSTLATAAEDVLLRALFSLRDRTHAFAADAARSSIEAALRVLRAWAGTDEAEDAHVAMLDEAITHVASARERAASGPTDLEPPLASVEAALRRERGLSIERVVAAQAEVLRGERPARATTAATFRASVGVPSIHRVWRPLDAPVEPPLPAKEEDPPKTPDELLAGAADALPGGDKAPKDAPARAHPNELEDARDERLALSCLQDIADLSNLRRPIDGGRGRGRWDETARFEEHMLASLDALVALTAPSPDRLGGEPFDLRGAALEQASEIIGDKGMAFACAFVLGCLENDDAIRDAVVALRLSSPERREAVCEAFALASSPAIRRVLSGLLHGADAAIAGFVLNVMRRRREVDFGAAVALLVHPDAAVASAAARALGAAHERDAATSVLDAFIPGCIDQGPHLSAVESLIELGAESGVDFARRRLKEVMDAPASPVGATALRLTELLALAGAEEDLALVERAGRGTPSGVTAMGWFGHAGVVPALLEELARESATHDGPPHPAAVSLFRILGEDPSGATADVSESLFPAELTSSQEAWSELWKARRRLFERAIRYRFGKPYTPSQSVAELQSPRADPSSRSFAALELRAILRGRTTFDPFDWLARQKLEIARLAEIAPELGRTEGEFIGDRLRRLRG
jgi:hypothetical protein